MTLFLSGCLLGFALGALLVYFIRTGAGENLDEKGREMAASFSDIKSKLEDYQRVVKKFEEERFSMYAKLDQSLAQVVNTENAIRMETAALKRVMTTSSGVRGKWGEHVLQQILEQNDFVQGIQFESQVSHNQEEGSDIRPDFIVRLPGGKRLVIDSKDVTGEYRLAQETDDPEKQKEHYQKLVGNIRNNFIKLSRREYREQIDPDVPFVIMFIPSEAAIRAAFALDPGIFEEAKNRKVILASPMTIMPLVHLISNAWRQQRVADNALELGKAVEELGNRLRKFVEHLLQIRSGIEKAAESWNKAVRSWQSRVQPQMTETKKLGGLLNDAESLTPVNVSMRAASLAPETKVERV